MLKSVARPTLPLLTCVAISAGCASEKDRRSSEYYRSPSLDYKEPARSASDGKVLGANEQPPADTLEASPTNAHSAPGWVVEDGRLVHKKERRAGGSGVHLDPAKPQPKAAPTASPSPRRLKRTSPPATDAGSVANPSATVPQKR